MDVFSERQLLSGETVYFLGFIRRLANTELISRQFYDTGHGSVLHF